MKNKKAITSIIFAGVLMIIAVIFKDNTSRLVNCVICFLGIILAIAGTYIEKKSL
ncbi:hypothetical protein [Eubacterium sp.]